MWMMCELCLNLLWFQRFHSINIFFVLIILRLREHFPHQKKITHSFTFLFLFLCVFNILNLFLLFFWFIPTYSFNSVTFHWYDFYTSSSSWLHRSFGIDNNNRNISPLITFHIVVAHTSINVNIIFMIVDTIYIIQLSGEYVNISKCFPGLAFVSIDLKSSSYWFNTFNELFYFKQLLFWSKYLCL